MKQIEGYQQLITIMKRTTTSNVVRIKINWCDTELTQNVEVIYKRKKVKINTTLVSESSKR